MDTVIVALLILNLILLAVILLRLFSRKEDGSALKNALLSQSQQNAAATQEALLSAVGTLGQSVNTNVRSLSENINDSMRLMQSVLTDRQNSHAAAQTQQLEHSMRSLSESVSGSIQQMKTALTETQGSHAAAQAQQLDGIDRHVIARQEAMNQTVEKQMQSMEQRLLRLETTNEQKLEALRQTMQTSLLRMQQENAQKLEEIRGVVDEKLQDTLQKRIADSFQTVSAQLEQVYKGLGEMQHLAADVGGLKQVLSGVKTRGILGEIQLKAILEEILSPEQYAENVETIPGTHERVEFAIRLPGTDGKPVYLPIDSKFPGDTYMHLQNAQIAGDTAAIEEARKALITVLRHSAKDIRTKYVEPPYTTSFGILFLPFEGLYAEVVNLGLIEVLQRDYSINIAGPSTMAALLNALQMGFHTLAIQKRSNEVWQVLGAVKTEFAKFEAVMEKMQGHLRQTNEDLESLLGVRTRAINRRLRQVHELDEDTAQALLDSE